MSAAQGQATAALNMQTLKSLRTAEGFDLLWAKINNQAMTLGVNEAKLPRFVKRQRRLKKAAKPNSYISAH